MNDTPIVLRAPPATARRLASTTSIIRRATPDDLTALVNIEERSFAGNRLVRRRFRYLLANAHAIILVDALRDGAATPAPLRGYILLLFRANSPIARIYSIATHPDCLGQGVASRLIDGAERLAREYGCARQRLEVRTDNVASLALFFKHGYRMFGRHDAYYQDGMDALRLEKSLGGQVCSD